MGSVVGVVAVQGSDEVRSLRRKRELVKREH